MAISDFRELRVYQHAFKTAVGILELSAGWPKAERYSLTDQVRRSSRSVCANMAEAWFKRRYPKHFISTLSDAGSEAAETMVWLDFAEEHGYLPRVEAETLRADYDNLIGGLVKMMSQPEKWCLSASTVREDEVIYDTDS